jgi:pyroglutamyl-peptidase
VKILITGFEPFGSNNENSSWVVANKVATQNTFGIDIALELMPVSFRSVAKTLRTAVTRHNPDLLIMLGQAGSSDKVRLERIAINMMDARNADNDGFIPDEEPINTETPVALFTNTDIKQLYNAIVEQSIPVKISNSCGLYVCNRIYYEALMLCNEINKMKAIFVHLPLYDGQRDANENQHTLPLDKMEKAINVIINKLREE